jgi:hypothetical protein
MDNELFDDLMTAVQQAIDYEEGDVSKARSGYLEITEDEIDPSYRIYIKVAEMSALNRQKVGGYIDGLLRFAV